MDLEIEKELVTQAKNDPEAFGKLFDFYYPRILNYTVRRIGNVETAKDITSIVFIKVLKNIHAFQWKEVSFSSWVYKIATNEIFDYYRRGKRAYVQSLDTMMKSYGFEIEDTIDIQNELIDAENEYEKHQLYISIQKQLGEIDIKYQEVITLKYFEKKKTGEIAGILGKKEGTVKSLLSRGLEKLRNVIIAKNATIKSNKRFKSSRKAV